MNVINVGVKISVKKTQFYLEISFWGWVIWVGHPPYLSWGMNKRFYVFLVAF